MITNKPLKYFSDLKRKKGVRIMSRLRVGSSENQGSYYVKDGNFSLISRPWGPTSYPVVTATSSS